jgi:hypothetical protein
MRKNSGKHPRSNSNKELQSLVNFQKSDPFVIAKLTPGKQVYCPPAVGKQFVND